MDVMFTSVDDLVHIRVILHYDMQCRKLHYSFILQIFFQGERKIQIVKSKKSNQLQLAEYFNHKSTKK